MKKTISLIMFCVSCAMGATPMDVTWDNNNVNLNSGEVSAVFTLNINLLKTNDYENIPLLTFNAGVATYGVMSYYDPGYVFPSVTELEMFDPSNKYGYHMVDVTAYKYATVGYTYNSQYGSKLYVTLIDNNGAVTEISPSGWYGAASEGMLITTLTKNAGINQIDIYESALSDEEMLAAMSASEAPGDSESPTVPEPATATLSLLALAGLAARRRR